MIPKNVKNHSNCASGITSVAAKDREGPDEGPAIGMQLGRGHIELCEQLPFEVAEGELLTDALEHRLIKEKEWPRESLDFCSEARESSKKKMKDARASLSDETVTAAQDFARL